MVDPATQGRKDAVRSRIWTVLDQHNVVIGGSAHGHIPHFIGADAAANQLGHLAQWNPAKVIKAVPDKAQLPARVRALREGKTVYMAVPKLATAQPFYLLDPTTLTVPAQEAASSSTAATTAPRVGLEEMRPVDVIICGSVAVDRRGKGAGYSDIEVALLQEAQLITPQTTITTVHPLQITDDDLPETEHDFRVDIIVTPTEIIECDQPRRPGGVLWNHLTSDKIAAIPILAARRDR